MHVNLAAGFADGASRSIQTEDDAASLTGAGVSRLRPWNSVAGQKRNSEQLIYDGSRKSNGDEDLQAPSLFRGVIVEAERYCESETVVVFYRGGLVSAEYPRAIVKEVSEVKVPQGRFGPSCLH